MPTKREASITRERSRTQPSKSTCESQKEKCRASNAGLRTPQRITTFGPGLPSMECTSPRERKVRESAAFPAGMVFSIRSFPPWHTATGWISCRLGDVPPKRSRWSARSFFASIERWPLTCERHTRQSCFRQLRAGSAMTDGLGSKPQRGLEASVVSPPTQLHEQSARSRQRRERAVMEGAYA